MEQVADPIQQQLVAARRNQILDAATQVFAAKGFYRTTIRDIAKTAGVADGTIYIYFANKAASLLGIMDRLNESSERPAHFAQGAHVDLRTFLAAYVRQRMALVMANVDVFRVLLPEVIADPALRARYYQQTVQSTLVMAEQFLGARMARGEVRELEVQAVVRALTGMLVGVLVLRLLGDAYLEEEWMAMPDVIATIVSDGVVLKGGQDD
jgi:TetR/AcrR family fatty acid metabolism transcriptional regulator